MLPARRVLLLGATGTIGRATAQALAAKGHELVCFVRPGSRLQASDLPFGTTLRRGEVTSESLAREGFRGERFDALVSCMASRTGAPHDAWAVDHQAHLHALQAAQANGVQHMVLLSAICVQKPLLAFQQAKLAFEKALVESGLPYSIVRPTAFFKSLSGQVARVQAGKPYLLFGDGQLTACKPISDADLADYIAGCLHEPDRLNRVLPIGGPGPALTPRDMGERLFALVGREPRFKPVPLGLMDGIVGTLSLLGRVSARLADKAELARIGRYYATESMLAWDAAAGRYDADATPEWGRETLFDYQAQLIRGEAKLDRGEHAVF